MIPMDRTSHNRHGSRCRRRRRCRNRTAGIAVAGSSTQKLVELLGIIRPLFALTLRLT